MMIIKGERINASSTGMTAATWIGVKIVLAAIAGLVLMLSGLLFGIVLGTAVLLWKLLGGRRGRTAHFGWHGMRTASRPRASHGDVIDVEMRDVSSRFDRSAAGT